MARFPFFRRRVAEIPEELWRWVIAEHPVLVGFGDEDLARLRNLSAEFLARKQLFAVRGAEISDDIAVSIAAQACLPVLHLGLSWYRDWSTLYLTPDEYEYDDTEVDEAGVVHEIHDTVSGQTLELGSIALSIRDVQASGWCDGYNVVIHEMAHVIDRQNGSLDGAPPLPREVDAHQWHLAFTDAFEDLQTRVVEEEERRAAGKRRKSARRAAAHEGGTADGSATRRNGGRAKSAIDPYAAEAPEEFFAVCTEVFFEQPWVLTAEYPEVYRMYAAFFRQDPISRIPRRRPTRR